MTQRQTFGHLVVANRHRGAAPIPLVRHVSWGSERSLMFLQCYAPRCSYGLNSAVARNVPAIVFDQLSYLASVTKKFSAWRNADHGRQTPPRTIKPHDHIRANLQVTAHGRERGAARRSRTKRAFNTARPSVLTRSQSALRHRARRRPQFEDTEPLTKLRVTEQDLHCPKAPGTQTDRGYLRSPYRVSPELREVKSEFLPPQPSRILAYSRPTGEAQPGPG